MIETLNWYKFSGMFLARKRAETMKNHFVSVFQAIIKGVSSKTISFTSLDNRDMPVFHIVGKKHCYKMKAMEQFEVEFLFFRHSKEEIFTWKQNLLEYLSNPVHIEAVEILSIGEIKERNYETLSAELGDISCEGEICLEFLMPLPFNREKGKSRVWISKEKFIALFEKHFSDLFGQEIKYEGGDDDFLILPYYWRYTEIMHSSKSQWGVTQYINGVIGKLYIKGTWKNFISFLILGSEVHIGPKLANSQGYYRVIPASVSYFEKGFPEVKEIISVTRDVIENYDHACEWLSKHENYPFDEKVFGNELCEELKNNCYLPTPNTGFLIRQKGKKNRVVEQMNFRDLIVSRYLVKVLYKIFDNIYEEESIGSRKGISRKRAIEMVQRAVEEGYEYIIEWDINDFFPSVDLGELEVLLERYLPSKEGLIKSLLRKLMRNGYILEGGYHERVKGLALGNPLSPCLANLYLDSLDKHVKEMDVRLIRFGDRFILCGKSMENIMKIMKGMFATEDTENSEGKNKLSVLNALWGLDKKGLKI